MFSINRTTLLLAGLGLSLAASAETAPIETTIDVASSTTEIYADEYYEDTADYANASDSVSDGWGWTSFDANNADHGIMNTGSGTETTATTSSTDSSEETSYDALAKPSSPRYVQANITQSSLDSSAELEVRWTKPNVMGNGTNFRYEIFRQYQGGLAYKVGTTVSALGRYEVYYNGSSNVRVGVRACNSQGCSSVTYSPFYRYNGQPLSIDPQAFSITNAALEGDYLPKDLRDISQLTIDKSQL